MGTSNISHWQTAFEDLDLELEATATPDGADGEWFVAIAEFSRHSFARLLLGPTEEELDLRLEIALGPVEGNGQSVIDALSHELGRKTDRDLSAAVDETPWLFKTRLDADDEYKAPLSGLVDTVRHICSHFDDVSTQQQWLSILDASSSGDDSPRNSKESDEAGGGGVPFESIGSDSPPPSEADADAATIESSASSRVGDKLHIALGFHQVLAPRQVQALEQGLEHHLHTKFDVDARPIEADERPELRMPSAARTQIFLAIRADDQQPKLDALHTEIDGFLERLEKFSSYGVDLFEYLGVSETVLEALDEVEDDEDADESQLSFRRRAPSSEPTSSDRNEAGAVKDDEDGGVVLDLGSGSTATAASTALESGNYTDPRLQRDDAQTPLVDLVLRHPGYSDRRIGQVLSILLSLDYHDAVDIADAAPCVIAWGIGQQRAQSFKEVIESAGGKILLVEPGTFGES